MLSAVPYCAARVIAAAARASRSAHRSITSARSNTLTLVAVNDVYDLEHLPQLRTLVDAVKVKREGGHVITTLAGDFLSPSVLSSLDRGRGMVQVLNAVGIDYACLGNHEADGGLKALAKRIGELDATLINSNVPGIDAPATALLELPGGKCIGVLGLLTSEPGVFRKDVFRGLKIEDVLATAEKLSAELRADGAAAVVALTHQSLEADLELARASCVDLVLGGHEHEPFLEGGECRVVKTGQDAVRAAVVDLDLAGPNVITTVKFEDVTQQKPHAGVAAAAAAQKAFLTSLDNEKILFCASSETLSSKKTRFQQTTVGRLLCSAVRDWFGCDACLINGGTIKGGATYASPSLSLLDLRRELPFPTKMIRVDIPGAVLAAAVTQSRKGEPADERRAFLQVCDAVEVDDRDRVLSISGAPLDPEKLYHVALPRNLCKGLFNITPLVTWAEATSLPAEDDFVPAMNCILLLHSYALWRRLGDFDDIDLNHDGVITRDEVAAALFRRRGAAPPKILLDNVMEALDADHSGTINREEFSHRADH